MPYEMPLEELAAIVDAPLTPSFSIDPTRTVLLLMHRPGAPSIEEVSRSELRLAGLRLDPDVNGQSRVGFYNGLTLKWIADGREIPVTGLPKDARIGRAYWAPDGQWFAFSLTGDNGIDLWVGNAKTGRARPVGDVKLNQVFGGAMVWLPDSSGLLVRAVCDGRGGPPEEPRVPKGPVIQENVGERAAPSRTYQDLLKNAHDELLFEYYATSQVALVRLNGDVKHLGSPGLICRADPSPDGRYVMVLTYHRPFSYLVPSYRFPTKVAIWDMDGREVRELVDLPLAESIPIAYDAVPEGARSFGWRADAPATVTWVVAQDGGDPEVDVAVRDVVYALDAPYEGDGRALMSLAMRYGGCSWGTGDLALVSERWWKTRRVRTWRIRPDDSDFEPQVLFDRSWEDRYGAPGAPVFTRLPNGRSVLMTDASQRYMFFAGDGASPKGDRPFLDRYDLETGKAERLMHSQGPFYERPTTMIDANTVLMSRESVDEPTNYYVRDLVRNDMRQLTHFVHPMPQLKAVEKSLVQYQRKDGVQLNGTLYLPPGYKRDDGPLPVLMWAYPREFKSADAAGQVKDSPFRFVRISSHGALPFLARGYAVLDGPAMPIVGEGDREANDTYVEQLADSARAAVDELVRLGVADPEKVAVGGHSYGGFMTANLLAHTDLFCCGIARSGAYNRTLTPFGFQAEERTFWQAADVYATMSPFNHVPKIKAPLLLIHGEVDNNSGTFPMQSERFYNALKGHGAICRLVMLPHESHGYRARESVMHVLWEMSEWLDKYAKKE